MFCNLYYSACGRIFQDHNFTDYGGSLEKRSAKEVHHDALEAELTQPGGIVDPRYVATVRKTLSPECFASFMRTVDVPVTKRDYYLSKLFQFFVSALLFRCGFNEEAEESCRALAKMLDGIADLPTERLCELRWHEFYADATEFGLPNVIDALPHYLPQHQVRPANESGEMTPEQLIRAKLKQKGWTFEKLSLESHVDKKQIYKVMKQENVHTDTIRRLAEKLECDARQLV